MGAAAPRDMHAVFALLLGLPGDSGYNPGYSGFGTLRGKTPSIGPETPDLGVRILRVFGYFWVDKSNWGISLVVVFGRWLIVIIKSYLH